MKSILLVWELGGGIGHLVRLKQVADELLAEGRIIYLASRNVVSAGRLFAGSKVRIVQAPYLVTAPLYSVQPVQTFMDILHNVGFGSASDLGSLVNAWLEIFRLVDPAVIVFDHSPTALLAARMFGAKRVLLGTGFASPDDRAIRKMLRPSSQPRESLADVENRVTASITQVCTAHQTAPPNSVAELFANNDLSLLATFGELDHYGSRPLANYVGVFSEARGKAPVWPRASRLRAVAYLKPHDILPFLVDELTKREIATLLYLGVSTLAGLPSSTEYVRIVTEPMNLRLAACEADFGLLNATHASTAELLLAGKPTIHLPLVLEQCLIAERVKHLAAGVTLLGTNQQNFSVIFDKALESALIQPGAVIFAERYRDFCPQTAVRCTAERILALSP